MLHIGRLLLIRSHESQSTKLQNQTGTHVHIYPMHTFLLYRTQVHPTARIISITTKPQYRTSRHPTPANHLLFLHICGTCAEQTESQICTQQHDRHNTTVISSILHTLSLDLSWQICPRKSRLADKNQPTSPFAKLDDACAYSFAFRLSHVPTHRLLHLKNTAVCRLGRTADCRLTYKGHKKQLHWLGLAKLGMAATNLV